MQLNPEGPRFGEHRSPPPRASRYFQWKHDWFFTTREGSHLGPFSSLIEAQLCAEDFTRKNKNRRFI